MKIRIREWNKQKEAQATFQKAKEFKTIRRTALSFDQTELSIKVKFIHTQWLERLCQVKASCKIYEAWKQGIKSHKNEQIP